MEVQSTIEQFRRLHIATSNDEEFKTSANSLLDELISHAHNTRDEKYEEGASPSIADQVCILSVSAQYLLFCR